MKVIRSIFAVILGVFVSVVVMSGFHVLNFAVHMPTADGPLMERWLKLANDKDAMKAWIDTMPTSAMLYVLAAWVCGAFFGGMVCALAAGRARVAHAGIIGVFVLIGTIINAYDMKAQYDFSHPDWMLVAGLLLPIPVSLLAGKLIAMIFPPPPANPS